MNTFKRYSYHNFVRLFCKRSEAKVKPLMRGGLLEARAEALEVYCVLDLIKRVNFTF